MNRSNRRPLFPGLAIGLAVFGFIFGAQQLGLLQRWELYIYDELIRARHDPRVRDERIVIIGINEADISRFDNPLDDEQLGKLVETIRAAQPRAIGLDLYRNLAVPRTKAKLPLLESALRDTGNLVAIFSLSDATHDGIPPPPSLSDNRDRIAFSDFPLDRNVVRRALLYAPNSKSEQPDQSLALSLALLYLDSEGVLPAQADEAHPDWVRLGKTTLRPFQANDGGYVRADAHGYQILLDFKFPTTFARYSYGDLIGGYVPREALRDKIVLIGTDAESVKDYIETPLTTKCPGILLHAQIINQLLREALLGAPQIKIWPEWIEAVWCLAWTLGGALIGILLLRFPIQASIYFCCALAGLLWISRSMFFHDWWIPSVAPVLGYASSAICSLGLVFFWERRDFRELMQIFSRHVSGKVARSLWGEREKFLEGSRPRSLKLTATVLFTDYVNFSSMAEKMEPVALLDWMNTGLARLARCVDEHDGIIIKYMGDSIMAVFGAPLPRGSQAEVARDAQSAVRCAVAMQAELEDQNRRWGTEGLPQIAMRIGIHTGPVVAGCIGSAARLEFTVTGDTVNTASHLENAKKEQIPPPPGRCCRILVGEATHELLDGLFAGEFVGEERLKGKATNIKVYRINGGQVARNGETSSNTPL